MVIYIQKKESKEKGAIYMLNDEICRLREKLNKSIEDGKEYDKIYKLSV